MSPLGACSAHTLKPSPSHDRDASGDGEERINVRVECHVASRRFELAERHRAPRPSFPFLGGPGGPLRGGRSRPGPPSRLVVIEGLAPWLAGPRRPAPEGCFMPLPTSDSSIPRQGRGEGGEALGGRRPSLGWPRWPRTPPRATPGLATLPRGQRPATMSRPPWSSPWPGSLEEA